MTLDLQPHTYRQLAEGRVISPERPTEESVSCLSSPWLECTHLQNTLQSPVILKDIFWRRDTIWKNVVGIILLLLFSFCCLYLRTRLFRSKPLL